MLSHYKAGGNFEIKVSSKGEMLSFEPHYGLNAIRSPKAFEFGKDTEESRMFDHNLLLRFTFV
jgi:hypothetical protein